MTPKEKRMLILGPLLQELEDCGYFLGKGHLFSVNRSGRYCVAIHPELYSNGCIKLVHVSFGTFYRRLVLDKKYGVALGEALMLSVMPGWSDCSNAQMVDDFCHVAADDLVNRIRNGILPYLRQIHDIASFVDAAECLEGFHPMATWQYERAWDYMALGYRERAYQFLDSIIHHPLFEAEGLIPNHRLPACQLLAELQMLDDAAVQVELEKRVALSERSCQDYFGVRRWSKC